MTNVIGYDGEPYTVGDRVEIHPGTDLWAMGARYGTVKTIIPTAADKAQRDRPLGFWCACVRGEMDKVRGLRSGPADRFRAI